MQIFEKVDFNNYQSGDNEKIPVASMDKCSDLVSAEKDALVFTASFAFGSITDMHAFFVLKTPQNYPHTHAYAHT